MLIVAEPIAKDPAWLKMVTSTFKGDSAPLTPSKDSLAATTDIPIMNRTKKARK